MAWPDAELGNLTEKPASELECKILKIILLNTWTQIMWPMTSYVWTFCSSWTDGHSCKVSPQSVQPLQRRWFLKVFFFWEKYGCQITWPMTSNFFLWTILSLDNSKITTHTHTHTQKITQRFSMGFKSELCPGHNMLQGLVLQPLFDGCCSLGSGIILLKNDFIAFLSRK